MRDLRRLLLLPALAALPAAAQAPPEDAPLAQGDPPGLYSAPFFPETEHDPGITPPEAVLGRPAGARLARHAEILALFRRWEAESPRLRLESYGRTHEGRELLVAVITSPANQARLDALLEVQAALARGEEAPATHPAFAWLGYSIHGDETSGADASLAVAWHLVSGRGEAVERLLENTVVVLDPCMNPDGRERFLAMVEQGAGRTRSLDAHSMARGRWPAGRGNHFLFDLNRDWILGSQPETRGRQALTLKYRPLLFVDAHEMGAHDSSLFYPQADPLNRHLPGRHRAWQKAFGDAIAAAFDRHGWPYYTREWADGFAPFYSDAWGSLNGAVGMLYEQAGIAGSPIEKPSGRVVSYRETVHHQAVATMASLEALQRHRAALLEDYAAQRRRNADPETPEGGRMLVLRLDRHPGRVARLRAILRRSGIEEGPVLLRPGGLPLRNALDILGRRHQSLEPAGRFLLVDGAQPQSPVLRSWFDFDPRMQEAWLAEERQDLERGEGSGIYDTTAWSLAHAFGVEAWWAERDPGLLAAAPAPEQTSPAPGLARPGEPAYAWIVDGHADASLRFAVAALEAGLCVRAADRAFTTGGQSYARNSLVVLADENPEDAGRRVHEAALRAGVPANAAGSGRSPGEGPDLGGGHFPLLVRPRAAILANSPFAADAFGHLWHELDRLGLPLTWLDAAAFPTELRRFNVLVLPHGWTGAFLEDQAEALLEWVRGGGTLIAEGRSAAALLNAAGEDLSGLRLRSQVLDELEAWLRAGRGERLAWQERPVDTAALWEGGEPALEPPGAGETLPPLPSQEGEEWLERFAPHGAFARAFLDPEHWLTAGCPEAMPVFVQGSAVLLGRSPAESPVRLAPAADLRISGLIWPEARIRLSDATWLGREALGSGQVILFAARPAYRDLLRATARLLGNAAVLGPGLGADPLRR